MKYYFHSAPECPDFTVEGSTQGNWAASSAGTTATIECATNYVLDGNSILTCDDDGSWSSDVPQCYEIGKLIIAVDWMCHFASH